MSKYRFALVSWAKGLDKEKTSIVPVSWIIDFDPEAATEKKYLVECRKTNGKKPANGWPVELAVILHLAEREATLRAAERELHLPECSGDRPKRMRKGKCLDFGEEYLSASNKASGSGCPKQKKAKLAAQRRVEEELLDSHSSAGPEQSLSQESCDLTEDLQSQIQNLHKENAKLRHMVVKEIPTLLKEVRKLVSIHTTNTAVDNRPTKHIDVPDADSDGPGETPLCTPIRPSLVEIGKDGVTVSSHCWETAITCTTANGMARVLLMGLFDVEVLLKSNLKGGFSKLDPSAERRQALDPRKVQALQDAVVAKFPMAKEADLRKSINSRMCELRRIKL